MRCDDILGWRRTALVRFFDDGTGLSAEAVGQGHRLPRVTPIPLLTAARLIQAGVPSVTVHRPAG